MFRGEMGSEVGRQVEVNFSEVEQIVDLLGSMPLAEKLREELEDLEENDKKGLLSIFERAQAAHKKRQQISEKKFTSRDPLEKREGKYVELEQEALDRLQLFLEKTKKAGKFLGEGATAKVYIDPAEKTRCFKIIYDTNEYSAVNSVKQEADFLSALAQLDVDGVRAPRPHYWAMHEEFHVLAMETLDAVCLRDVISGKDTLPDNFKLDESFQNLDKYIDAMHERGIHHRDLNPQNVMVDRKTGKPYVIDFGKAYRPLGNEDPYLHRNEATKEVYKYPDDKEKVIELRNLIRNYLKTKN